MLKNIVLMMTVIGMFFILFTYSLPKAMEVKQASLCGSLEANLWMSDDDGKPNSPYSNAMIAYQNAGCK